MIICEHLWMYHPTLEIKPYFTDNPETLCVYYSLYISRNGILCLLFLPLFIGLSDFYP